MFNAKKFIDNWPISFKVFCAIACFIQLFQVTSLYFKFHVTVDSDELIPELVEYPAVTVCFNRKDIINHTSLELEDADFRSKVTFLRGRNASRKLVDSMVQNHLFKKLANSTIQYMDAITYKAEEIVSCEYFHESSNKVSASPCKANVYFAYTFKCFSFLEMNQNALTGFKNPVQRKPVGTQLAKENDLDFFLHLSFSQLVNESAAFFVIHNASELFTFEENYVLVKFSGNDNFHITYWKRENYFMESPYVTNCLDYSKERKVRSKKQCLAECKVKKERESSGRWPKDVPIEASNSSKMLLSSNIRACIDICPSVDCFEEQFHVSQDNLKFADQENNGPKAFFRIPTHLHVRRCRPKLTLAELVCLVGSALGMWFGVSIVGVFRRRRNLKRGLAFMRKMAPVKIRPLRGSRSENDINRERIDLPEEISLAIK